MKTKKKTAIFILFLFIMIFFAQNIFAESYIFKQALTCKDIEISTGEPFDITNQFIDTDDFAAVLIYLEYIYKSLNVYFEWYSPQNDLMYDFSFTTNDPNLYGGLYWSFYRVWSWINIANITKFNPNINIYGQWHIDIFIDGNKISRLFFTLNPSIAHPQLYFPLWQSSPYNAEISSVLDHSGNFYERNGVVLAYTGEKGKKKYGADCYDKFNGKCTNKSKIWGYKKQDRSMVSIPGQCTDLDPKKCFLWYDGHPGYDYRAESGDEISAPADGTICISTSKKSKPEDEITLWRDKNKCPYGNDPINGKNGKKSSWDGWHTFYIVHKVGIENYTTWYLHSSDINEDIKNEILEKGYADVSESQTVAYVGHFGLQSGDHLHFEVRKGDRVVVDPYGWEDQPILWIEEE